MLCGGGVRIIDEIANIDDLKQVRHVSPFFL